MNQTGRRQMLLLVGPAWLALTHWAGAQTPKRYLIGILSPTREADLAPFQNVFVQAMRAKGWTLGEHYAIEARFADGDARRFPVLADELIELRPDVLYGVETAARVMAAKTSTIPIVLGTSIDPVAAGLVKSLARPGTNVTGMSGQFDVLIAKHVELLSEIVPKATHLALVTDPNWSAAANFELYARTAAASKAMGLSVVFVTDTESVRNGFAGFERRRPDGLIIGGTGATFALRREIGEAVRRLRLPAIGLTEAGGLVDYGVDILDQIRQSADFVDRIFRGARPADMPVRQATTYVFVVNLKLAREIGVTIPQSILLRADKVIE